MSDDKIKLILIYDEQRDDFTPVESEELDPKGNTYLVIDENTEKSTLSFPENASLIQKRTIERRVSSYLKVGYPVGDKGLRIGANFPLEKIGIGEKVPDVLMTHGHTFGKARLQRDEIPDYIEKEDNYDVVPGSAASKPFDSGKHGVQTKSEDIVKPSVMEKPQKSIKIETPPFKPEVETPSTVVVGPKISPSSTEKQGSDNEIFALGQFVDQFVRKGKVALVYFEDEKYKIQTVKNVATRLSYDPESKYEVVGSDLFEQ